MITAVWSVKGGVGVTTVAALLALSRHDWGSEVLLVDLAGDVGAVLGLDSVAVAADPPTGPGVSEWLELGRPDAEALARLEVPVRPGLHLIARGAAPLSPDPGNLLAALRNPVRGRAERDVVIDCGRLDRHGGLGGALVEAADLSLVVVRECFVALRALQLSSHRLDGVVVIKEPRRELGRPDVELVANAPVVAEVAWDSSVFRAVDAGVARSRLPRGLLRSLDRVARRGA